MFQYSAPLKRPFSAENSQVTEHTRAGSEVVGTERYHRMCIDRV